WLATEQGLHVYREEGLILSAGRENGKRDLPRSYTLEQNYPNPFNPSTKISFSIPEGRWVKLTVYDIIGREITTLVNEYKPMGSYTVEFNAGHLTSGVYVYTIQAGEFSYSKKLLLLR
ncbi:MAG: T9SS type A sorting domain-containing protein, partial [Syntrophothermus sp.]